MEKVEYLGLVVDFASIRVDYAKVQGVEQWPACTVNGTGATVLTNYYRKFVLNFALQAAQLTDVL